jgi:uncharacterized protein with ParB-like and HNH nuclease domain
MSYRSESIQVTVSHLNSQYFLPAIQREFVWEQEKIIQLFDSILREYPISSFLFWELKPENRNRWEAYTFINEARDGGTHNNLANTNGVKHLTLVLDGQQRLTSLLIGLKGSYISKRKYMRWDNPDAWVRKKLYLDLLKDSRTVDENGEAENGIYFGFAFLDTNPKSDERHQWFEVGKILDFDTEKSFDDFRENAEEALPDSVTKGQTLIFRRNLERLYRAIWKDDVISYYTENDQEYDRVLDIFVRANEGGIKLSKADLLLSMITSKWDGVNAREEIYGFVDRLNKNLVRKNDFDKDFIMKSCLVLTDLPVAYKVENFNNQNLEKIKNNWEAIKSAIERSVELINFFGIDRENLTSANALIPLIYYLFPRPNLTLRKSTPFEANNASRVRKWIGTALLNGVFGGSSDNLLRDTRSVLQNLKGLEADFPVDQIAEVIQRSGRKANFDDFAVENVLALTYGQQLTFLALTLLYEESGWGTMTVHQDHIFPQNLFRPKNLGTIGLDKNSIDKYVSKMKSLANLQLLPADENAEKQDKPFEEWIATRDSGFKKRHLIPDDPNLWKLDRFEDFIAAREVLITKRLKKLFSIVDEASI